MAREENNLVRSSDDEALTDWATLATRIVADLERIVRAELKLFQAGLHPLLRDLVGRVGIGLVAVSGVIGGGLCFLAALVLFLHQWLQMWQALAVAGAV